MAAPITGTPYRILYQSKPLMVGLTDVIAYVCRPDFIIDGPIVMLELPGEFGGAYWGDYITNPDLPAGEYFVRCFSATVGQFGDILRISFDSAGGGSGEAAAIVAGPTQLVAFVDRANVVGRVEFDEESLLGQINDSSLFGGVPHAEEISGLVSDDEDVSGGL